MTTPRRTRFEWLLEALAATGVIVPFLLVAHQWDALPERLPSHFDASGRPDAWRAKGIVLLLPMVSVVLHATLSVLSLVPQAFNYPWEVDERRRPEQQRTGREMVTLMKAILAWSVVWITRRTIQVGLGERAGLGDSFVLLLLLAVGGGLAVYGVRFYRMSRP